MQILSFPIFMQFVQSSDNWHYLAPKVTAFWMKLEVKVLLVWTVHSRISKSYRVQLRFLGFPNPSVWFSWLGWCIVLQWIYIMLLGIPYGVDNLVRLNLTFLGIAHLFRFVFSIKNKLTMDWFIWFKGLVKPLFYPLLLSLKKNAIKLIEFFGLLLWKKE